MGKQALTDGDVPGAIAHFKRALEQREGDTSQDQLNLAAAYAYSDEAPLAYVQYKRVLERQKDSSEALIGLSEILRRQGRQ